MKRLLFIAICFCMALSVSAGKKKDFVDYSYELTYVKDVPASTVGFTVFKVWSYGKKKELLTKDICMRINPAKRNVLNLKNETCKNREKRNVLKISRTRHFKTTKKQSRTGCFYSF